MKQIGINSYTYTWLFLITDFVIHNTVTLNFSFYNKLIKILSIHCKIGRFYDYLNYCVIRIIQSYF